MMRMHFLAFIALLASAALVDVAKAQGPVTNSTDPTKKARQEQERIFYNEQILTKSVVEISGMSEAELRSLMRYFTECEATTTRATRGCSVAQSAYLIEFGTVAVEANRSIDSWIVARSRLELETEIYAETFHKLPALDMDQIFKKVRIEGALRDAMNHRFRGLRATKQNP